MSTAKSGERLYHPFPALFDENSRTLILGSFPSVKSREQQFFYGHPQNRFWRVLAAVFSEPAPQTIAEKRALVLAHHLALWDVVGSCTVEGSSDASIGGAAPNDLSPIFLAAPISRVFTNGKTAYALYERHQLPQTRLPAQYLPSTSPANAAWSFEKLVSAWRVLAEETG